MPECVPKHLRTEREQRDWAFGRIDELEHELEMIRADQAQAIDAAVCAFVGERLGLTPALTRLLISLYSSSRALSKRRLWADCRKWSDGEADPEYKLVNVRVCGLRKVMGSAAVRNVWGYGYALGDEARAKVDELIHIFSKGAVS